MRLKQKKKYNFKATICLYKINIFSAFLANANIFFKLISNMKPKFKGYKKS